MDQFIRTQNVERFRRLLERVTEESAQQTIFATIHRDYHVWKQVFSQRASAD
jgi:hypothetical protein